MLSTPSTKSAIAKDSREVVVVRSTCLLYTERQKAQVSVACAHMGNADQQMRSHNEHRHAQKMATGSTPGPQSRGSPPLHPTQIEYTQQTMPPGPPPLDDVQRSSGSHSARRRAVPSHQTQYALTDDTRRGPSSHQVVYSDDAGDIRERRRPSSRRAHYEPDLHSKAKCSDADDDSSETRVRFVAEANESALRQYIDQRVARTSAIVHSRNRRSRSSGGLSAWASSVAGFDDTESCSMSSGGADYVGMENGHPPCSCGGGRYAPRHGDDHSRLRSHFSRKLSCTNRLLLLIFFVVAGIGIDLFTLHARIDAVHAPAQIAAVPPPHPPHPDQFTASLDPPTEVKSD